MTRARLIIIVVLAATAGALWLASRDAAPPPEIAAGQGPAVPKPSVAETRAYHPTNSGPMNSGPLNTGAPPVAARRARLPSPMALNFAATDDLLAFIEGIQGAAEDGDGAAAYYMYRALDRCQTDFARRFGSGRRERSFNDVLADETIVRQFGVADLTRIYGQCQRLRESDMARLGPADDWLTKGADAGFPRAQAELAVWHTQSVGSAPQSQWSGPARELARAALSSKNPEVFVAVSRVIGALAGEEAQRSASWYVAACLRGLDCGPGAEITQLLCGADPACRPDESVLDLVRRNMGDRFGAVERGANQINAAIDAGRFEALGL